MSVTYHVTSLLRGVFQVLEEHRLFPPIVTRCPILAIAALGGLFSQLDLSLFLYKHT